MDMVEDDCYLVDMEEDLFRIMLQEDSASTKDVDSVCGTADETEVESTYLDGPVWR